MDSKKMAAQTIIDYCDSQKMSQNDMLHCLGGIISAIMMQQKSNGATLSYEDGTCISIHLIDLNTMFKDEGEEDEL